MRRYEQTGWSRIRPGALWIVGAALVVGVGAWLAPDRGTQTQEPVPTPVVGRHGMQVAIDPETGALGLPTPEQAAALQGDLDPDLSRSSVGLQEVHHPNGAVSVDLQGRFQNHTVARIGADGVLEYECTSATPGSEVACDHDHKTDVSEREVR